jgi:hypothetical protein
MARRMTGERKATRPASDATSGTRTMPAVRSVVSVLVSLMLLFLVNWWLG